MKLQKSNLGDFKIDIIWGIGKSHLYDRIIYIIISDYFFSYFTAKVLYFHNITSDNGKSDTKQKCVI